MTESVVWSMNGSELLAAARDLVRQSQDVEAELLVHLGEIDERRLYLDCAFPSMFAFCVGELGFSEDAAYNRIMVARAGRRFPVLLDAIRDGRMHLWGMRLLIPHLTEENHLRLLEHAAGKSKREIEELVAKLAPHPGVATVIRKVPDRVAAIGSVLLGDAGSAALAVHIPPAAASGPLDVPGSFPSLQTTAAPTIPATPSPLHAQPGLMPLAAAIYKVQFTAGRDFRDKLREAQDLMRHRVPDGSLETILGTALDLLIEKVKKERFAVGRKARAPSGNGEGGRGGSGNGAVADGLGGGGAGGNGATAKAKSMESAADRAGKPPSRHIPDAVKRAVYERDGGRCTFVDERGRRCEETGHLEFDHVEGFAQTGRHDVDSLRLLCRAHNQRAAEQRYGQLFMEHARKAGARGEQPARDQVQEPVLEQVQEPALERVQERVKEPPGAQPGLIDPTPTRSGTSPPG